MKGPCWLLMHPMSLPLVCMWYRSGLDEWAGAQVRSWILEDEHLHFSPWNATAFNGTSAGEGTILHVRRLQRDEEDGWDQVIGGLIFFCGGIGGILGIGACWRCCVVDKRPEFPNPVPAAYSMNGQDFKYKVSDCCGGDQGCAYCGHGTCCTWQRAADNYHAIGAINYWLLMMEGAGWWFGIMMVAFLMELLPDAIGEETGIYVTFFIGILVGYYMLQIACAMHLAMLRGKLREKFGGDSTTARAQDVMLWWCCACCVAVQEAKQVDEAMGMQAACCCELRPIPPVGAVPQGMVQVQIVQPAVIGNVIVGQPVVGQPVTTTAVATPGNAAAAPAKEV